MHQHPLVGPAATRAPCQAPPLWLALLAGKDSDGTEQVQRWRRPGHNGSGCWYGSAAVRFTSRSGLLRKRRGTARSPSSTSASGSHRQVRHFVRGEYMTGTGVDRLRRSYEQRYAICVGGRLGETVCSAFPDLQARAQDGDTILSGVFADQAALYGVLAQLESLGLELIEVRRLPRA